MFLRTSRFPVFIYHKRGHVNLKSFYLSQIGHWNSQRGTLTCSNIYISDSMSIIIIPWIILSNNWLSRLHVLDFGIISQYRVHEDSSSELLYTAVTIFLVEYGGVAYNLYTLQGVNIESVVYKWETMPMEDTSYIPHGVIGLGFILGLELREILMLITLCGI